MSGQGSSSSPASVKVHYCHKCKKEFIAQSSQNFTCVLCGSGFIEEVGERENAETGSALDQVLYRFPEEQQSALQNLIHNIAQTNAGAGLTPSTDATTPPVISAPRFTFPFGRGPPAGFSPPSTSTATTSTGATSPSRTPPPPASASSQTRSRGQHSPTVQRGSPRPAAHFARQTAPVPAPRPNGASPAPADRPASPRVNHHHFSISTTGGQFNHQLLNGIVENILGIRSDNEFMQMHHDGMDDVTLMIPGGLGGIAGVGGSINGLHGNLGDYAWGAGGIDNILTQLMTQMDNTGVPPASTEDIHNIQEVSISKTDVDKLTQCSVCMEYFKVGEPVKKLKCSHMFHKDCIVPWLQIHNTCPVCRKGLDGKDPPENNQPGIPADSPLLSNPPVQREYQEEDFD